MDELFEWKGPGSDEWFGKWDGFREILGWNRSKGICSNSIVDSKAIWTRDRPWTNYSFLIWCLNATCSRGWLWAEVYILREDEGTNLGCWDGCWVLEEMVISIWKRITRFASELEQVWLEGWSEGGKTLIGITMIGLMSGENFEDLRSRWALNPAASYFDP